MDAWRRRAAPAALHHHGNRRDDQRDVCAQSWSTAYSTSRRLHRSCRPADCVDGAIARNSSAATVATEARCGAGARCRSRVARRAASILAAPCNASSTLAPGEHSRCRRLPRTRRMNGRSALADRSLSRRRSRCDSSRESRAIWGKTLGAVQVQDARPGDGHHAERLAALSNARLPHPGRARRSIKPAAPTGSAINCKTSWRLTFDAARR